MNPLRATLCILSACALFLLVASSVIAAGNPSTITFSLDFPKSDPAHYTIMTASDGHSTYECAAKVSADSDETQPYTFEFDVSPATRARIFELAAKAKYFSGKVDSGNRKLAFTGAKKLTYTDAERSETAEFNYPTQPAVQQLTELFQQIAATMEYGRRITNEHRYQKLALDDELKSMEEQERSGQLQEVQALHPLLKAIVDDNSVMNVVRARAERIIAIGQGITNR